MSAHPSRNPFIYSGHFNYTLQITASGRDLRGSQSLHLFRAFQLLSLLSPKSGRGYKSQSLLLFRAFQLIYVPIGAFDIDKLSQSLPFFRAFQHNRNQSTISFAPTSQSLPFFRAFQHRAPVSCRGGNLGSQSLPFFRAFQQASGYAGNLWTAESQSLPFFRAFQPAEALLLEMHRHILSQSLPFFRAFQPTKVYDSGEKLTVVAIPSFFQGISTGIQAVTEAPSKKASRNPFLFSGHFNAGLISILIWTSPNQSQSLPFFRAFQQQTYELLKQGTWESRNPFIYSGHFNTPTELLRGRLTLSVAIPSFIQGISTVWEDFLWGVFTGLVAIPSFIQGISTVRKASLTEVLSLKSQSLHLFRAFQPTTRNPW